MTNNKQNNEELVRLKQSHADLIMEFERYVNYDLHFMDDAEHDLIVDGFEPDSVIGRALATIAAAKSLHS